MKNTSKKFSPVSEEWVKEFVLSIYCKRETSRAWYLSEDQLRYEIMLKRKNDMQDTQNILETMKSLGLDLCRVGHLSLDEFANFELGDLDHRGEYNLLRFAELRGYLKLVGDKYEEST